MNRFLLNPTYCENRMRPSEWINIRNTQIDENQSALPQARRRCNSSRDYEVLWIDRAIR
jgi:hypothetical protein